MTLAGTYSTPLDEFIFYDEGVGPFRDAQARLDTIENHVLRFRDLEKRKILQIDVEGAEWEAFLACPAEVLATFDHIVVELHGLCDLRSMRRNTAVLAKLNLLFVVVHVMLKFPPPPHAQTHDPPHACAGTCQQLRAGQQGWASTAVRKRAGLPGALTPRGQLREQETHT